MQEHRVDEKKSHRIYEMNRMSRCTLSIIATFNLLTSCESFLLCPREIYRHKDNKFSFLFSLSPAKDSASFDLSVDLTNSDYQQVITADLPSLSKDLRRSFDALFSDPREPNGKRFAFDPWVVRCGDGVKLRDTQSNDEGENESSTPGELRASDNQVQYSLKRAQLSHILDDGLYDDLIDSLTQLGRSIGCSCITPPWISMYTDGDMQNFHTDSTHGPMAFVLSLSSNDDYGSKFTGGETVLLRSNILDYWRSFDDKRGLETPSIMRFLPPTFGRCIAFDPRIPHGVNKVCGSNDPRHSRIAIHGWFAAPETTFFDDLEEESESKAEALEALDEALKPLIEALGTGEIGRVVGFLAVKVDFDEKSGSASQVTAVCDTLVADPDDYRGVVGQDMEGRDVYEDPVSDVKLTIEESLGSIQISEGVSGSIVVPFEFS